MRRFRFRSTIVGTALGIGVGAAVFAWHRYASQIPFELSGFRVDSEHVTDLFEPDAGSAGPVDRSDTAPPGNAVALHNLGTAVEAELADAGKSARDGEIGSGRFVETRRDDVAETEPGDGGRIESGGTDAARLTLRGADALDDQAAAERLSEALRHPSDSFRDSTLITLIRNAGHVCTDVVWSAAGRHDSSAWRVSCDGARSFMVAEDRYGGFVVEPLPYIETIFTILPPVEVER